MERVASGSPYEPIIGYCRALRVGDRILVSGTTSLESDGSTHAPGDAYHQAKRCLETIMRAVVQLDGHACDVVRTRIYLVNAEDWESVGQAHGEFFGENRPAATMVVVAGLLRADWLVEIEAEAVVTSFPF